MTITNWIESLGLNPSKCKGTVVDGHVGVVCDGVFYPYEN